MNKEQTDGLFEQVKGGIKSTWGKLTDDDIMMYNGQREKFFGKVKEHYGLAKEETEKKMKALEDAAAKHKPKVA
ncbi:MAG: CsbD family protein [Holosporales bacterium]